MLSTTTTPSQRRQAFRAGLASGRLQVFPGAFTPLSARLIQDKGFDGAYISGQACMSELGLPDIVIANAGISLGLDLADAQDLPVFAQVMNTNVQGLVHTFQPFIAPMCQRGRGQLVGMASVAGIRGLPGHAAYCASKAAVISCCESLRGELKPHGVKVTTIAPGYVATPLTARNRYSMPFLMQPQAFAEQALRAIDAGASFRVIPWPMGVVARVLRFLPDGLLDRLLQGRPRKHRHTER